jgi:hypothetical protein
MLRKVQVPSPLNKPKNKLKVTQIIPIVIIIVAITGALYFSGFLNNNISNQNYTNSNDTPFYDGDKLTPTRDIEGTWKTTFTTQFTIATDYENFGLLSEVGTEDRIMTWTIIGTNDEHVVLVNIQFTYSNRQIVSGSGYTVMHHPCS